MFLAGLLAIGLTALEIVSYRLTGIGFNQAVVYHLEYGLDGAGFKEFVGLIVKGSIALVTSVGIWAWLIWTKKTLFGGSNKYNFVRSVSVILLTLLTIATHPTLHSIIHVLNPEETDSPIVDFYQTPSITQSPLNPPNIVWIYGESLERTYMNEDVFPGLMPNLKKLEQESLSFTDIAQVGSVGFTIGGIVASQCGVPLITSGGHGNSMGSMPTFLPGAVCIGDLLRRNAYQLAFFGGADPNFAGKGKFLKTHGFQEVYGKEQLIPQLKDRSYVSDWGLYDDSLFELAAARHKELVQSKKPYGLFVLTLDTHHPYGHIPKACEAIKWGDGKNPMYNAVACSDKLIADFVKEASERDPNTLFVIASDHLAMWNYAYDQLAPLERRNLLMFYQPGKVKPSTNSRQGTTYESGVTALDLMGFQTNGIGIGRSLVRKDSTMRETLKDPEKTLAGWSSEFRKLWRVPNNPTDLLIDPRRKLVSFSGFQFPMPIIIDIAPQEKSPKLLFGDVHLSLSDAFLNLSQETRSIWLDSCDKVRSVAKHENNGDPNKYCLWDDKVREIFQIDQTMDYALSKTY